MTPLCTSIIFHRVFNLAAMNSTKRALLIASPFSGLRGPIDDVKIMDKAPSSVLKTVQMHSTNKPLQSQRQVDLFRNIL